MDVRSKSKRAHKNYPRDIIILDENNLPLFLVII